MKLSFPVVCILFGVTLVHLVIIASLSPLGVGGEPFHVPVPEGTGGEKLTEESSTSPGPGPEDADEVPAVTSLPEPVRAAVIDLPAQRREEAPFPGTSAHDPVATTRPVPQSPRS
jgi:hypothetical protein